MEGENLADISLVEQMERNKSEGWEHWSQFKITLYVVVKHSCAFH
jgi:hypothetical protein